MTVAATQKKVDPMTFLLEGRLSFPNLFKPRAYDASQEAKYSAEIIFTKDKAPIVKKAIMAAIEKKWGSDKTKWPKGLKNPLKNGDDKSDMAGYAGHDFIKVSTKMRPVVLSPKAAAVTEEDNIVYPGCYVKVRVNAYPYFKIGNGVSLSFDVVQKIRDGEPFTGRRAVEEDFGVLEDGSEDESSYSNGAEDDSGIFA